MGIALWIGCAVAIFIVIWRVPFARRATWIVELMTAIVSALILGALATALDFGGWNEPDWRAALFVFFGSAAIVGSIRFLWLATSAHP